MSIGIPSLLIGILEIIFSLCSSVRLLVIAEETKPGAIAFTVIPLEATSKARDFVKPIIPAFEAQ